MALDSIALEKLTRNADYNADHTAIVGDGTFDSLMEVVTKHVELQFDKGHIDTNAYAQVYLGALQSTLQAAIEFNRADATVELEKEKIRKGIIREER